MGRVRRRHPSLQVVAGVVLLVAALALILASCPVPTGPEEGTAPAAEEDGSGSDPGGGNDDDPGGGNDNDPGGSDPGGSDPGGSDPGGSDPDDGGGTTDPPATYGVTYHPNGADAGSVPTDAAAYESGDTVTVLGNTGGLSKAEHTFSGWNTSADQSGTTYQVGDTIAVADADIDLYAFWMPGGTVTIDFQNPDDPAILFAGASDQVLKGTDLAVSVSGPYTGHTWYLDGSDTDPALTAAGASATIATGGLGYGTHTVTLIVAEGYSASFSFDIVDTVQ